MDWDDLWELLMDELQALGTPRLEDTEQLTEQRPNWTLRQEHTLERQIHAAYAQRLTAGSWPPEMPTLLGWLVALRIHAILAHLPALSAMDCPTPQTVEALLEKLAIQQWPQLRFDAHVHAAMPPVQSSMDDPWEDASPPTWLM